MKTLWQHFLDFIQPFFDPMLHDEKDKRKYPLSVGAPRKMERFTQRARRVLGLAQEAAERFQHTSIRPEHMLIALIREVDSMAGSVLKELKVDLKKAEELVGIYSDPEKSKLGVNLQLSEETKKLLELSVDEARRKGHAYIGTEHLLLALVHPTDNIAIQVLRELGVTPADVRKHVHQAMGDPAQEVREHLQAIQEQSPQPQASEDPNREQFTPSFQRVRAASLKEAERLHHAESGTEHILLALLLEQEGIAAQVLREYKLDLHQVEALVARLTNAEARKPDVAVVLSAFAQKLRDLAIEEARQLRDLDIGPEHLLLAIGQYEGCTALRILRESGIDIDDLRTRTLKAIEG